VLQNQSFTASRSTVSAATRTNSHGARTTCSRPRYTKVAALSLPSLHPHAHTHVLGNSGNLSWGWCSTFPPSSFRTRPPICHCHIPRKPKHGMWTVLWNNHHFRLLYYWRERGQYWNTTFSATGVTTSSFFHCLAYGNFVRIFPYEWLWPWPAQNSIPLSSSSVKNRSTFLKLHHSE
jgi:hypothetical protein